MRDRNIYERRELRQGSGYVLWKTGLLGLWKKLFGRKLKVDARKIESWMPIDPEQARADAR